MPAFKLRTKLKGQKLRTVFFSRLLEVQQHIISILLERLHYADT